MKTVLAVGMCLVLQTACAMISTRCLSLMRPCVSADLCKRKQVLLRNVCASEDSSCQMPSSEGCNVTIQAMLAHSRECMCADENPCNILQLLASFCRSYLDAEPLHAPDKSRLVTQQASHQTSGLHPYSDNHLPFPVHENNPREEWKEGRPLTYVPAPNISCVQEMMLCIQDEACNRQLVPFVQSCSVPQCEERLCRLAARQFYSSLPENLAEMLVFCQCATDNQDCQHFHTMLNSNSCKQDQIAQWNCLEMLDNCTGEKICRQTFEAFLSKCFGPEDVSFTGYSTTDLLHVIDLNFFVSGNKECRLAFVATMGSVLQSPCTCHGLDHHDHYRCNLLQQAIHNRSYFSHPMKTAVDDQNIVRAVKNPKTTVSDLTSTVHGGEGPQRPRQNISSTKSKVNSLQQEHSWLNDQLLYIVVSVCVLTVAIIAATIALVMHKLWKKCSLSKNPDSRFEPPEDSTKSLVL